LDCDCRRHRFLGLDPAQSCLARVVVLPTRLHGNRPAGPAGSCSIDRRRTLALATASAVGRRLIDRDFEDNAKVECQNAFTAVRGKNGGSGLLEGSGVGLASADSHRMVKAEDEYLAVTDLPGFCGYGDRLDDLVDLSGQARNFEL
jgi:hypothetical protein